MSRIRTGFQSLRIPADRFMDSFDLADHIREWSHHRNASGIYNDGTIYLADHDGCRTDVFLRSGNSTDKVRLMTLLSAADLDRSSFESALDMCLTGTDEGQMPTADSSFVVDEASKKLGRGDEVYLLEVALSEVLHGDRQLYRHAQRVAWYALKAPLRFRPVEDLFNPRKFATWEQNWNTIVVARNADHLVLPNLTLIPGGRSEFPGF
jgi:hypothetical protein